MKMRFSSVHVHFLADQTQFRLSTRARFEKDTKSNLEMAYSANSPPRSQIEPYYSFVSEEVCL